MAPIRSRYKLPSWSLAAFQISLVFFYIPTPCLAWGATIALGDELMVRPSWLQYMSLQYLGAYRTVVAVSSHRSPSYCIFVKIHVFSCFLHSPSRYTIRYNLRHSLYISLLSIGVSSVAVLHHARFPTELK
jgi:hypothetical protein